MAEDRSTQAAAPNYGEMINDGFGKSKDQFGVSGKPVVDNDGTQGGAVPSPQKLGY